MFEKKEFTSHSNISLTWKIECDDLTNEDIETLAYLVSRYLIFSDVIGVPTGGLRFAKALERYKKSVGPVLIVDDVLTTGRSMEDVRATIKPWSVGIVIFARGQAPDWITPIFQYRLE